MSVSSKTVGAAAFTVEAAVYDGLCAAKCVLTPGSSQHHGEPGWFRICYAFVERGVLDAVLAAIQSWVEARRAASTAR